MNRYEGMMTNTKLYFGPSVPPNFFEGSPTLAAASNQEKSSA